MRLKQIGKEIEGLKTKEKIKVNKDDEKDNKIINNEEKLKMKINYFNLIIKMMIMFY